MPFLRALSLTLLALAVILPASAQTPRHSYHRHEETHRPVSVGGYLGAGAFTSAQPYERQTGPMVEAGLFAEWAKYSWRPGVDMRVAGHTTVLPSLWGGSSGTSGSDKLIGPRLSYARGIAHPYIGGLFGSAHDEIRQASGSITDVDGVVKLGTVGLDLDAESHVQFRVFEYGFGHVPGPNGPFRQTFTTGIVLRFP